MSNKLIFLALSLFVVFTQPGCVVPVDGTTALNYDPAASYSGGSNTDVFRKGYDLGRHDAISGRPENFAQHQGAYDWGSLVEFSDGYEKGYENYTPIRSTSSGQRLTATVGQGQVEIRRGSETVSVVRTAMPNVENHHFTNGHNQIVTKSRGNHGPATVELFDVQTGTLRDKVLAYAIENGEPSWARGMQD